MKNLAGKVGHLLIAGILVMAGCGGKGDPGAAGSPGENGTDGINGTNGDAGPQGKPGANGANGVNGDAGLQGKPGANGANGDAGVSTALLSVTITNSLSPANAPVPVPNATVTLTPAVTTALKTDAKGSASVTLPIGDYTLSISATGYTTATQDVELVAGIPEALAIKLVPTAKVVAVATASSNGTAQDPGATVTLNGSATVYDGSTPTAYSWAQTGGPTATLAGATTQTPTLTMPSAATIKAALVGYLQMPVRLGVLGINPYSITQATTVVLTLTVTTSSGSYNTTVNVSATAPFQVTSGLRNVPTGVPQLLQASGTLANGTTAATTWNWTVTSAPGGSKATITDAATQYPIFTPDQIGDYVLSEATTGGSLKLYAGTWQGAIGSIDAADGLPDKPTACSYCHKASPDGFVLQNGASAPDIWQEWRQTGHAVIVPENIDAPGNHWTFASCGSCHSVGYNTLASANNGGADDVQAVANWQQPAGAPGVYESMFQSTNVNIQTLAGLMNVQCDNCHGPTNSDGHSAGQNVPLVDQAARVSLSAEVCGQCHGEPLHHGRYQEWQLSGHANGALAIQRAVANPANDNATTGDNSVNSCARCHSAEGYVAWEAQSEARGFDFNHVIQGAANNGNGGNATGTELRALGLTPTGVHPQTCATCHDPHNVGKTSGLPNTTNVRVQGDIAMLASGFAAPGLGQGAVCATCHNSRNGLHDDTVTSYSASGVSTPHDSTVADVFLGQNAYFVTPGQRGGHSYITNTCANCHMELTLPPASLSNTASTNHTFTADMTICKNCHGAFDGGSIQTATQASLSSLATFIGTQGGKAYNGMVFWTRARRIPANANDTTAVYSHAASTGTDLSGYNVKVDLTSGVNSVVSGVLLENSSNLQITLANPIQIQWTDGTAPVAVSTFIITQTSVRSDDGTGNAPTNTYPVSLSGNLAKAIWNYIILYREGSFGIHNPGFTNLVIGATMSQDLTK